MADIGWRFGRSDRWILAREKSESTLWMGRDDGLKLRYLVIVLILLAGRVNVKPLADA